MDMDPCKVFKVISTLNSKYFNFHQHVLIMLVHVLMRLSKILSFSARKSISYWRSKKYIVDRDDQCSPSTKQLLESVHRNRLGFSAVPQFHSLFQKYFLDQSNFPLYPREKKIYCNTFGTVPLQNGVIHALSTCMLHTCHKSMINIK